jgi:hypothetical protein
MTHLYQPFQPLAADGGAIARVLTAAGLGKRDLIRVVGASAPVAALWLARHGYERAVVARGGGAARPADAVLIGQPCAPAELDALMAAAGVVADDGAVVAQGRSGPGGEEAEALAAALGRLGYRALRRLSDKGRPVLIARRVGEPTVRQAA